ncbi:MAG: sulfatase [Verrucomicrobiota bacterium]
MKHSLPLLLLALCLSSLPAETSPPNVFLITTDDMNCDLATYGHPLVNSPNLDRLAARGLLFERAYCQYPVCNPSRSSFMTGLYPESTGILSNAGHFRENVPDVITMPQLFRNNGYFAARIGKIYHYGVPPDIGTDGKDDPPSWEVVRNPIGIDKAVEPEIKTLQEGKYGGTLSWLNVPSKDEDHTDGIGATQAIDLLETHHPGKTGKPFFIAMGFYRPHTPFVAPPHYFDLYPTDKIEPVLLDPEDRDDIPTAALPDRPHQLELTIDQRKEIIQAYYASISLVDTQVGRLLDALDRLDLTENTIVVFLSDHGYHLGHHGLWQKSDLFEGSTRVPLIFSVPMPGMAKGETTQSLVELTDVYPTLVELCGLPRPDHLQGVSLVPILENPLATVRDSAYSVTESRTVKREDKSKFLGRTIRTDRYRYTEWDDGEFGTELYDYENDPEEFTNLAPNPEKAALVKKLQQQLRARKKDSSS